MHGTISLREDEEPKLLVDKMEPLVEDGKFVPTNKAKPTPAAPTLETPKTEPQARKAAASAYSPELAKSGKLYLRIPQKDDLLWQKACNLAEIFDGVTRTILYDTASATYHPLPHGVALSQFVYEQFVDLLGAENVVLKS
jgi:hypothetical protein